ncbi:MAG: hypothetical protein AAF658_13890, partial [Myxococcota bacterium]
MRSFAVSFVLLALGLAAGCAGDVEDINRVQPGFVKKSELLGKSFYYRRTVMDAPEALQGGVAAIGSGDLFVMERVKFEIQEDILLAYRDFEFTPNSNGVVEEIDETFVGTPIAVIPITQHFDIQREFNPATGEQTNVISANTTDREWFEREFFRLDWGRIQMTLEPGFWQAQRVTVDTFDINRAIGGDFYVFEDEAESPFRARITPAEGYMDFVVNHTMVSDPATCANFYDFGRTDPGVCGNGEVKLRHAFMEIDDTENDTYDPLFYPDSITLKDGSGNEIQDPATGEVLRENIFDRFGYYRLDRLTYDDERGLTESGRIFNMLRFDIWDRSVNAAGSVIPFADRTIDPIVYYLNWDFPDYLLDAAAEVGTQWNQVFREAVAEMQNRPISEVPDVFIVRRNSCSRENLESYWSAQPDIWSQVVDEIPGTAP